MIITVSEPAQAHFQKLLEAQPQGTQIRVFVTNPGTATAECGVSYCPADAIDADDLRQPCRGFDLIIDSGSEPFLKEAEIDLVQESIGSQLTLKAPNAKLKKVADDAPLAERVNYFIQAEVNPGLANHGGHVSLVEITPEGVAVLQFGGGCNGCSMVDVTLKEGIERQLLNDFADELTGVCDATEHQRGSHSYY